MALTKKGRATGTPKTGGRKKGVPNKISSITREVLSNIALGLHDQVMQDLLELEPKDRVTIYLKLCEFVVPRLSSIALDMSVEQKLTIEQRLLALSTPPSTRDKQ